jgi:sensor c-di-GMP phosphodiesterase-like protein
VYFFFHKALEQDYQRQLDNDAQTGLDFINVLAADVVQTLRKLDNNDFTTCTDANLVQMRKQMFLSKYIKDIGFFNEIGLLCTTGKGRFDAPLEHTLPDFIDPIGASIWVNEALVLFEHNLSALLVRYGNYNAVIPRSLIDTLIKNGAVWEIIKLKPDSIISIAGQEGIFHIVDKAIKSGSNHFQVNHCTNLYDYCIAIQASPQLFYKNYQLTLYALAVIGVFVFIFFVLFFNKFFMRYRSTEARVSRGLKNNAFYCLYQPIVELESTRVIGFEVLARYEDSKGAIYPDVFIPIVSQLEKSWPFTKAIIDKTYQDMSKYLRVNDPIKTNINFFAQDISSGKALELLDDGRITSSEHQWVIEVTEDEELARGESSRVLETLVDAGFEVAIDDFGTGYSNLSQVKDLNCNTLKIDRSFVSEMEGGSVRSTLIPHMIDIAEKIGAKVVAEGIENSMQHEALKDIGVQYGQGWMFGKPMTMKKLSQLIQRGNDNKRSA